MNLHLWFRTFLCALVFSSSIYAEFSQPIGSKNTTADFGDDGVEPEIVFGENGAAMHDFGANPLDPEYRQNMEDDLWNMAAVQAILSAASESGESAEIEAAQNEIALAMMLHTERLKELTASRFERTQAAAEASKPIYGSNSAPSDDNQSPRGRLTSEPEANFGLRDSSAIQSDSRYIGTYTGAPSSALNAQQRAMVDSARNRVQKQFQNQQQVQIQQKRNVALDAAKKRWQKALYGSSESLDSSADLYSQTYRSPLPKPDAAPKIVERSLAFDKFVENWKNSPAGNKAASRRAGSQEPSVLPMLMLAGYFLGMFLRRRKQENKDNSEESQPASINNAH